mmetsp:Transcript_9523/g.24806  ORF Transcript_9523/g.24806 Transcript_9523/m.24806 type:complete len:166 (+) Transcript_9523:76-573(+)
MGCSNCFGFLAPQAARSQAATGGGSASGAEGADQVAGPVLVAGGCAGGGGVAAGRAGAGSAGELVRQIFFKNHTAKPVIVEVGLRSWRRSDSAWGCSLPPCSGRSQPFQPADPTLKFEVRFGDEEGNNLDVQGDVTCEFGDVCVVLQDKIGKPMASIEYLKKSST